MNKHKNALKNLMLLLVPCLYLTVIPAEIVKYGMATNIPAFDNGAPFNEVYSVFFIAWTVGHLITGIVLYGFYMLCYGCQKAEQQRKN